MSRPPAAVSVDVDPVDLHLTGYGFRELGPDSSVYTHALPRLLDLFSRHGVRATFFVVGRDAAANADAIASLIRAGHEVASHSMSHPMPFAALPPARLAAELQDSRRVLAEVTGASIEGFRAPNWDVTPRVLDALVDAGYRWDASILPSPFQIPARVLLALKARDPRAVLAMRPWPMTLNRKPRRHRGRRGAIGLLPVSTLPGHGFPLYHTARYLLGEARFLDALDGYARRREPLSYPLHAVDAMGLEEDRVDRRLGRHPGMERSLESKLALLDQSLGAIARRFEPLPCGKLLESLNLL